MAQPTTAEQLRLNDNAAKQTPLEKWGPYVSERQWGTVREDYSENGDAWNYLSHDGARSRAYLWGEDGLAGISDYFQNLCFAIALWNGKDTILKERLFGLTNGEGNHGEDVKELYYYLDNLPTHFYMKYLYKYPQAAYPYTELIERNRSRSRDEPEFEILDTDVFKDGAYFDVFIEYAKADSEDIFIKIEIINRAKEAATITVLPTLWFYNRWQYGGLQQKPVLRLINKQSVQASHERLDDYYLYFEEVTEVLFTENETNKERASGQPNKTAFVKDAFHEAIINGKNREEVSSQKSGTKCSPVYVRTIDAKESTEIFLRLTNKATDRPFEKGFDAIFAQRKKEADEFYEALLPNSISPGSKNIQRQAFAGLLWSKQYYHLDLERWLNRSDGITPVTEARIEGRNSKWPYLKNQDVISMPDKWEYPWYAAWDTAFHCIAMAVIDPVFAKNQLLLFMREWYMNPEGQLPAYEWNFSDVNPPVHAFAALEVYRLEKSRSGQGDVNFLKKAFQKLIINFTWWTNRKDSNGNNVFEGGFLGLDNIALFNRSNVLPTGFLLEQADGTSWMGIYALNMMDIALEISQHDAAFEDSCTKFYEHFVLIAEALNELGLWNEEDRFFYDVLAVNGCDPVPVKVRSIVGIIPLLAASIISKEKLATLPDFNRRMKWFENYRTANKKYLPHEARSDESMLLSLVHKERLLCLLERLTDEEEFLGFGGIRALSKHYKDAPYSLRIGGTEFSIQYNPGDSTSGMFGGNSNWRGPVWMPVNYLIIQALEKYAVFYGNALTIECPKGSGHHLTLKELAAFFRDRFVGIFERDEHDNRPLHGPYNWFYNREENRDLLLFHEYFHGDDAHGLGASHQTGWTALVTNLIGQK